MAKAAHRVGNFEFTQKLGSGSYAQVFRAIDVRSGDSYAIKAVSKEKVGDPKLQENLENEISIMRDYLHPNVVRLYDHFSSSRYIYLVLELCEGGDLSKYIKKCKRVDERLAVSFLKQLSDGLYFLSQKNLIHRDLKPANVLLSECSERATLKLADFGFAKHLAEASMAQTPCGTPLYMAPEIFEMHEYDAKADLWSVGCIFYEMLVGTPPFKGSNPRELFQNIKTKALSLPTDVVISLHSLSLLKKLLERNPIRRASLDDFCSECSEISMILLSSKMPIEQPKYLEEGGNIAILSFIEPDGGKITSETIVPIELDIGKKGDIISVPMVAGRQHERVSPATATTMLLCGSPNAPINRDDVPSPQKNIAASNTTPNRTRSVSGASTTVISNVNNASLLTATNIGLGIGKAIAFVMNHQPAETRRHSYNSVLEAKEAAAATAPTATLTPTKVSPSSIKHTINDATNIVSFSDKEGSGSSDDDFVIIDPSQAHPFGTGYQLTNILTTHDNDHSKGILKYNYQNALDLDSTAFVNHIHRCEYVCNMLNAISSVADAFIMEAIQNESHSQKSISIARVRCDSFDQQQINGAYSGACSLYLHALNLLRDTLMRTKILEETLLTQQSNYISHTQYVRHALLTLFDQLVTRVEHCQQKISLATIPYTIPSPEPLMYKAAMNMAAEANVEELLGNLNKAQDNYLSAKFLIESVLITAVDQNDKRILQQFAQQFSDQQEVCKTAAFTLNTTVYNLA